MTTTETGKQAEKLVAAELKKRGYKVLDKNWRTRWCEIDLIAQKQKTIFFVEVKYRNNNNWGGGLEAITPKKLQQMAFAAEIWVNQNKWQSNYELMAASVNGNPPKLDDLLSV